MEDVREVNRQQVELAHYARDAGSPWTIIARTLRLRGRYHGTCGLSPVSARVSFV
jgi:hypothetical protein